jgi:hypothetical protein
LGKTDIEDALRRLDQLTQEEVRMATARLLTLTHSVDSKVARMDDEVKGVNDRVKDVTDTVKVVLDGAWCLIFSCLLLVNVLMARWKRSKINLTANRKRSNSHYATYGEQRLRNKEFVVPYCTQTLLISYV